LGAYEQLHGGTGSVDEGLFRKVLLRISCRDFEAAAEAVPGAIGLSKSTVWRELKKATAAKLKAFQERDLSEHDVVAIFLDGKLRIPTKRPTHSDRRCPPSPTEEAHLFRAKRPTQSRGWCPPIGAKRRFSLPCVRDRWFLREGRARHR
jgi:hypothetical protein